MGGSWPLPWVTGEGMTSLGAGGVFHAAGDHLVAGLEAEAADHDVDPLGGVLLERDLLGRGVDQARQGPPHGTEDIQPLLVRRWRRRAGRLPGKGLLDGGDDGGGG